MWSPRWIVISPMSINRHWGGQQQFEESKTGFGETYTIPYYPTYDRFFIRPRVVLVAPDNRQPASGVGSLCMGHKLLRLHRPGSPPQFVHYRSCHTLPAASSCKIPDFDTETGTSMSLSYERDIFVSLRPWTSRPISRACAWHVSIIWGPGVQLRYQ